MNVVRAQKAQLQWLGWKRMHKLSPKRRLKGVGGENLGEISAILEDGVSLNLASSMVLTHG